MVYRSRMLRLLGASLCLHSLQAQDWQELLPLRPEYPEVSLTDQLEESPAQRAERILVWENALANWVTQMAAAQNLPLTFENTPDDEGQPQSGENALLSDFTEEGFPIYIQSHNLDAAIANHSVVLREGPQQLKGQNEIVGIWDTGNVRDTHQEFLDVEGQSRVSIMDSESTSDHGTHVGGTMGAAGVDSNATGMAPQIQIHSWGWAKMLSEAPLGVATSTADFLKPSVSNHSYGSIVGWTWQHIDSDTDNPKAWHWNSTASGDAHALFGRYDKGTVALDELLYSLPNYLHIRSAGNHRTDNPQEDDTVYFRSSSNSDWISTPYVPGRHPDGDGEYKGGYGTISNSAITKNNLTVGNYTDGTSRGFRNLEAMTPNPSTGWGPADDGRVKPDVVANGTSVYSTSHDGDDTYTTKTGTSMAAPSVTGTAALLQQRRRQFLPQRRLNTAELKGLLIHSADDILNPGPDYRSGWGVVNAASADFTLTQAVSNEPNFFTSTGTVTTEDNEESIIDFPFTLETKGPIPLKATLVWTDPAGTAQDADSSQPVLIHDLDLRIYGPDDEEFLPFVLDPNNPKDDATTGDNRVDNVEQVLVTEAVPGNYTIRVSAKEGGLLPTQDFALWVSPALDPLAVQKLKIEVPFEGDTVAQQVRSNSTWSLGQSAAWLDLPTGTEDGDQEFDIEVEPNFNSLPRETTIPVEVVDSRGRISFVVQQEGFTPTPTDLENAAELAEGTFTTSPTHPWFGQIGFSSGDGDAAMSAELGDDETSWLRLEIEGPGFITFDYYSDSETADQFFFLANGSFFLVQSGTDHGWQEFSIGLNPGPNLLEWRYEKDESVAVGADRAAIDNIRINRANLSQNTFAIPEEGGEFSLDVDLNFNTTWAVRLPNNPAPWLSVSESERWGDESVFFTVVPNLTTQSRTATFEIGSNDLGYQTVAINQASSSQVRLTPAQTFPDPAFSFSQAGDGTPWFGLATGSANGEATLVATELEPGQFTTLTTTIEGPGFLSFSHFAGVAASDDIRFFINGEAHEPRNRSASAFVRTNSYSFILPSGTNEVAWRYARNGDAAHNTVRVEKLKFIPGSLEIDTDFIPNVGITTPYQLTVPEGIEWFLSEQGVGGDIEFSPELGTGPQTGSVEIGPNVIGGPDEKNFFLRIDGIGFSIPVNQEPPIEVTIAEALDQPTLVFSTNNSFDPFIPSRLTIGQKSFSRDDRDAVAFAQANAADGEISTQITGPAQLTFDYHTDFALSTRFQGFFVFVDDSPVLREFEPTQQWQSFSLGIPAGTISEIRWVKNSFGKVFLDRLRITRPGDLTHGLLTDAVGGSWISSEVGTDIPTTSSAWATFARNGDLIEANFLELPEELNSRFGSISYQGEEYPIAQIRPQAIEEEYLLAMGVSNVDELYAVSDLSPFADSNGNGIPNAVEWAFGQNPTAASESALLSPAGLSKSVRDSPWVLPAIRSSTDLSSWNEQVFTLEENFWTISNPGQAFSILTQSESAPGLSDISLGLPSNSSRYFYQSSIQGR